MTTLLKIYGLGLAPYPPPPEIVDEIIDELEAIFALQNIEWPSAGDRRSLLLEKV
jgi:hypothetical protein